jgi:hypothetical protein
MHDQPSVRDETVPPIATLLPVRPRAARFVRIILRVFAWVNLVAATSFVLAASSTETAPKLRKDTDGLPILKQGLLDPLPLDWLVEPLPVQAAAYRGASTNELVLDNGLIRRTFRLAPNAATVALENLMNGSSVIRAVKPEDLISLDGHEFAVGGLLGQKQKAYLLPEWLDDLKADPAAFQFEGYELGLTVAPLEWKRKRHAANLPWPAPGIHLALHFQPPTVAEASAAAGLEVIVHYELYDGLPVFGKWLELLNHSGRTVNLDSFTSEMLATVEKESVVDERDSGDWLLPSIDFLSDYSFRGMDVRTAQRVKVWLPYPEYTSQVNYSRKMPALLVSRPPLGPDLQIQPGATFQSYRTYVVIHDRDERERQGLALRQVQRHLAPWITENPIMMHVRGSDTATFRRAVDQCAEVGFEMIIYTFGSGLNMENEDPDYLRKIKADADYAHVKGIEVGAYSLLASRRVNDQQDVINPETGKTGGAVFGNSPCLGSAWAEDYFRKIKHFIEFTGLDLLEHDGSYPGDVCASTNHPGHHGLLDSQWRQWERIVDLYHWCRARGVYLNVPDYYFLAGSSKTGMGYREDNWSLPRDQQLLLGRQNIYDGTWQKTPSMGWMFVPLVEYHGGGAAATLEPLSEHLDAYEAHMANNFSAGVQACFRGPRLYDTDRTRAAVRKWTDWFRAHRDILESDIIHLRRPDGRDLDGFLHVNPRLERKAMAVIFNPLNQPVARNLMLPLYYAGLTAQARVRERDGAGTLFTLDREYRITVPVKLDPHGMTWLVVEAP